MADSLRLFVKIKEMAMPAIRDHGVQDYAGLRDIDATDVGVLGEDDRACLEDLGRYLAATDAWQRFGIWLLHKHFEPCAGEVFVERSIAGPRETETTPIQRSGFGEAGLSTTAIRFDESVGAGEGVIGMEFAAPSDFGDTEPLSDDDKAALAGIADQLESHGKLERFGVRLIRNPLNLSEHELLSETCDTAGRTLHCHVGERDALLADDRTVQTAWRWKVVQGEAEPVVMQECTLTCTQTTEGHDASVIHGSSK